MQATGQFHAVRGGLALAACLASLALAPIPRASAQCDSACNKNNHHWDFGGAAGNNNSEWLVIGLTGTGANGGAPYKPIACQINPWVGLVVVAIDNKFSYPNRMVATDVSFCGNGGDDYVLMFTDYQSPAVSCLAANGSMVNLQSFVTTGNLKISGGDNNDDIRLADYNDSLDVIMCGGDGNDSLVGSWQTQYMFGGNGNDFLYGGSSYDWVRGNSGDDVLKHYHSTGLINSPLDAGIDYLRGDNGNDCVDFFDRVSYDSRTDGGPGNYTDTYEQGIVNPYLPPPGFEAPSPGDNCCAEAGKYCPADLNG